MKRYDLDKRSSSVDWYAGQSKGQSLHMLVRQGSKVGKLVYGKHIPLRERRLLEKLVQTRALYDEVRNQILRNNLQVKNELDPKQMKIYENDKPTLQRVIQLVDKGQVRPSHFVSTSCSCCSCNSKLIHRRKTPKHPKYFPERKISSSSAQCTYDESGKVHERYVKRRPKTIRFQNVSSESCICALNKLRDLKKKVSKIILRKISKEKAHKITDVPEVQSKRKTSKIKKLLCACKVSKLSRSSLEIVKHAKTQLGEKISSSASIIQNKFRIKKDSIMLYRDNLKKKREIKPRECKPNYCLQDKPCYDLIKSDQMQSKNTNRTYIPNPERLSTPISIRIIPHRSISQIASEHRINKDTKPRLKIPKKSRARHVLCECKPAPKSSSSGPNIASPKWSTPEPVNITRSPVFSKTRKYSYDTKRYKNDPELRLSKKSFESSKDYSIPERDVVIDNSERSALGISSSFRFEIEFYKQKYPMISDEQVISSVQRKRHDRSGQSFKRRKPFKYEVPTSKPSEWIPLRNEIENKHNNSTSKSIIRTPPRSTRSTKSTMSTPSEDSQIKRTICNCNLKPKIAKCKCAVKQKRIKCKCTLKPKNTQCQCIRESMSTQTKQSTSPETAYVLPPITSLPEPNRRPVICDSSICRNILRDRHHIRPKYNSKEVSTIEVQKRSVITSTSKSDTQSEYTSYSNPHKYKIAKQSRIKRRERRYKREPKRSIVTPNRSITRIGSSFSYNIEFYREKSNPEYSNFKDSVKKPKKHSYKEITENKPKQSKRDLRNKMHQRVNKTSETNHKIIISRPRESFLQKCLCTLRLSKRRESEPLPKKGDVAPLGFKIEPIRAHKNSQSETTHRNHAHFKSSQFSPYAYPPPDTRAPYENYRPHETRRNYCSSGQYKQVQTKPPNKHKGIYIGSTMQKCFCTLKLHKSGHDTRLKEKDKVSNIGTETTDITKNNKKLYKKRTQGEPLCSYKPRYNCTQGHSKSHEYYGEVKRQERTRFTKEDLDTTIHRHKTKSIMSINTANAKTNTNKHRKYNYRISENEIDVPVMDNQYKESPPSRNVLRLGSSCKFNIEFYKEQSLPEDNSPVLEQREEEHERNRINSARRKNWAFKDEVEIQRDIQQDNEYIGKTSSVGVVLKKCFCSLKLHKKGKTQIQREMVTQSTITPTKMMKRCHDTPHSIHQHANNRDVDFHKFAEPPKHIDKRIGPEKLHFKNKSVTSSIKSISNRSKKIQSKLLEDAPQLREKQYKKNSGVRLGSNVNFDIEFYKNTNSAVEKYHLSPTPTRYKDYQIGFFKSEAFQMNLRPFEINVYDYLSNNNAQYKHKDCKCNHAVYLPKYYGYRSYRDL